MAGGDRRESFDAIREEVVTLLRTIGLRLLGLLAFAPFALGVTAMPAQAAGCQFVLGFGSLDGMIPSIVGQCVEDERHNADNGDAFQHTSRGLLVWRKADNWTAFTDGFHTWVLGPVGLLERLNTQRFSFEANPEGFPVIFVPVPTSSPPSLSANGQNWTVSFERADATTFVREIDNDDDRDDQSAVQTITTSNEFLTVVIDLRNNQGASATVSPGDFSLTDSQGRAFSPVFDTVLLSPPAPQLVLHRLHPITVASGATVQLVLAFNVPANDSGLVLHLTNGNDVAVTANVVTIQTEPGRPRVHGGRDKGD